MLWLTREIIFTILLRRDRSEQLFERFCDQMRRERRAVPEDLGLGYEAIELETDDGRELAAWFVPPVPTAAVETSSGLMAVIHHHFGGQKATTLPWLEFFAGQGIPAIAIDGRDHGGSYAHHWGPSCFGDRALDLHAACDELKIRGARRLLLVGQSQGAAVAIKTAGQRHDVAGLVVDSGPALLMSLASWTLARSLAPKGDLLDRAFLFYRVLRSESSNGYVRDLLGSLWRLRDTPLLWIHSEADHVIPRSWVAPWFVALRRAKGCWSAATVPGGHVHAPQPASDVARHLVHFICALRSAPSEVAAVPPMPPHRAEAV